MAAAFVQATNGNNGSGGGSATITTTAFAGSTTSGNAILVAVQYDIFAGGTFTSITDSKGNVYTAVGSVFTDANGNKQQHFFNLNIVGGASHTVSANFGGVGGEYVRVVAHEVSGLASRDKDSGGNAVTATSGSATSVTPDSNNEYIFASGQISGGTSTDVVTAGAGFTEPASSTASPAAYELMAEYQVQTTATAVAAGFSRTSSGLLSMRTSTWRAVGLPATVTGISTAVATVGPFKTTVGAIVSTGAGFTQLSLFGDASGNLKCGQTWTTDAAATPIKSASFRVGKTGSPTDNLVCNIYATSGGLPTGASLATSSVVAATSFASSDVVTFTFSTPFTPTASTLYAAALGRSGSPDSVNYFDLRGTTSSVYAGGTLVPQLNSGTWVSPAQDAYFIAGGTDAYYFFGRDGTTATTLQAFKATAPDTSWASIATKTGFATGVQNISAYQVGNVIHMCITDGATTSINHKYQTFDAATDTFVTAETINSALNTTTSASANAYGTAIVVRSTAEVIVHYQAARISNNAQTAYRRRTGVATWAAGVAVSTTGVNAINPFVVLGASDRLHFLWFNSTNTIQRHLTSANVLGTAASTGATATVQDVATLTAATPDFVGLTATSAFRWSSADNPTVTNAAVTLGTPVRASDTAGVFYALYQSSTDSDLYIKTSSDNGATWGTAISEFVGTVVSADANLSKNQLIYTRGSATVFPYIVNDNGTLRYDEYPISAGVTHYTMPVTVGTLTAAGQPVVPRVTMPIPLDADLTLTGQTVALQIARKTTAGLGTLTLTGQDVTLTKTSVVIHRTMPADTGTLTLAGQTASLRSVRKLVAGQGTLTLAGQVAVLRAARTVTAGLGTLTLSGQAVVPRVTMPITVGTLTLAGQTVTLKRNYAMPVTVGTLTLAGQNAVLTEKNSYGLIASHGVMTLAGQDVALRSTRKLVAGQGTLTLAGQVATTRFAHLTVAGLGMLTLAGQTAIVRYARRMPAGQGTLTPSGQNVTLRYSRKMPAGLGTITLAGQTVNTIYSGAGAKLLPAGLGTITLSGQTATLRYARRMIADTGTLTLSGQDVTLTKSTAITHYSMPAALGTLTLAGQAATLTKTGAATHYRLAVEHGTLTLDGQSVIVRYAHRMAAGVGVLTVSGRTVTLDTTAPATFSTLTLSGRDVTLRKINKLRMPADAGTLALSGQVLTLRRSRVPMVAALGTLTLSGRPIALPKGRMLAAEVGSIVLSGKAAGLAYKEQIRMAAEPGILHLVEQDVILSKTTAPPVMRHETLKFGRSVYVSRW